jgi:hypothetical protein
MSTDKCYDCGVDFKPDEPRADIEGDDGERRWVHLTCLAISHGDLLCPKCGSGDTGVDIDGEDDPRWEDDGNQRRTCGRCGHVFWETEAIQTGKPLAWTETFAEGDCIVCDLCHKPMVPNISLGDEDGYAWICLQGHEGGAAELEPEDLVAVGVPLWVAEQLVTVFEDIEELCDEVLDRPVTGAGFPLPLKSSTIEHALRAVRKRVRP